MATKEQKQVAAEARAELERRERNKAARLNGQPQDMIAPKRIRSLSAAELRALVQQGS